LAEDPVGEGIKLPLRPGSQLDPIGHLLRFVREARCRL
jgi:hypothetical protein